MIIKLKTTQLNNMMVKTERNNKIVKCSLVGDGLVGKTSLVRKFANHKMNENYVATVFDNFAGMLRLNSLFHFYFVFNITCIMQLIIEPLNH